MGVEAVISTQVIDTTSVGRSLMTAVDTAAARSALSLGTLATQNGTISDYLTAATAASTYQVTLVSATNIKTVNGSTLLGSGDLTISGLSGTGSVDNAILRADGTGGATLQNSPWIINDNLTASPNNTVNHACLEATGGTTNVSVSIKPKGSGAFCLSAPDGTATGGNASGANAVDLQTSRGTAAQVASGAGAAIVGGASSTASGTGAIVLGGSGCTSSGAQSVVSGFGSTGSTRCAVALGYEASVTGSDGVSLGMRNVAGLNAFAVGRNCNASNEYDVALGGYNTASGGTSLATGGSSLANRGGMHAHAFGAFAIVGDAQAVRFVMRRKTTDATPTTLMLEGSAARLTIPSGKVASLMCRICGIKSDGSAVANYVRRVVIKNVGGTTSLVGSVETIGTDIEDNASTDVAITADNTNDALQINVTGIAAETWRWVAVVEGLEIAYGT